MVAYRSDLAQDRHVERGLAAVPQSAVLSDVEFTLDGNLHELARLAEEITWFCEENALSSEVEFDLNLAMEELFTNAVRHGGCEGMKDAVQIRLERRDDAVNVEFADNGREFDPASSPPLDLTVSLAERQAGGLGLHLVRRTMSDLQYRRSGGWNHITMRRSL
jgi:serine/threonine-protein kinase RsbW